ncbi:MAG TPA: hypothetical protein VKA15_10800 [Isosphaeraceae bacterium]|nr:hypothetical protein [Isosphaeraceae bacterium]
MNRTFKSIATVLFLLAAAGCAGEEQTQPAPPTVPVIKQAAPPKAQGNAAPGGMSAEMQPPASSAAPAKTGEQKPSGGPLVEGPKVEGDQAAAGTSGFTTEQLAAIKELPASEQQAAIKQMFCPVSGEPLGSMGKPRKVSALGRSFYLCCKGCEKDVTADPKSVLAKLDQKRP